MLHFGFDLDGVCFDWQYFVDWHNSVYGTNFTKEEFLGRDFSGDFEVPHKILENHISKMYKTIGMRNLIPAKGAVSAMRELSLIGETSIVTSRPPWAYEDTMHWLRANFNRAITGQTYFARNHHIPATTSHLPTKVEICIDNKINYIIEDDPIHAVPCAEAGVRTFLFGYYGNSLKENPNLYRVYSFPETIAKIREIEGL